MTPEQILSIAHEKGILLKVQEGHINYKAPPGTMTPSLVESIRTFKKDIIDLLNSKKVHSSVKCLSFECNHARYENVEGSPWLWCSHLEKAVIHLMECPQSHWQKNAKGFPLPNNNMVS